LSEAQSVSARRRGRPHAKAQDDIRQRIIETALRLFVHRGYAATPVRQIAESVGVNGAMIHYYFGSKEALLMAILEAVTSPFAQALADMKRDGSAPAGRIVDMMFDVFSRQPDLPVLMMREVLLPGGAAQKAFVDRLAQNLGGALPGLLATEQAGGRIRADADPAIMALQLLSLCAFPFVSRGVSEPALGLSFDKAGVGHLRQQTKELLAKGVLA
jgi:AcrR family transcriptional regulator